MPGLDKTGPLGTGPIGRGLGPCRGSGLAGWGGGRGFRRGGGMGWGMMSMPFTPDEQKGFLTRQKKWLESQVDAINKQLNKLSKTDQEE